MVVSIHHIFRVNDYFGKLCPFINEIGINDTITVIDKKLDVTIKMINKVLFLLMKILCFCNSFND